MSLFHNILDQLSKKLKNSESYKDDIAKEISNIIKINITADQITIKTDKIFLSVSPTIKTVISLKKDVILEVLKKYRITAIV